MAKYRLKYTKLGKMCYIGHLDMIHIVQRAIKRAGLPVKFSQGFNPHQQMGFALPLPLGMASMGEYVELELSDRDGLDTYEIAARLGSCLPEGLNITAAMRLKAGAKSAAALTAAASYEIRLNNIRQDISGILKEILALDAIILTKKTKTSLKDTDIRRDIYELSGSLDNGYIIHALLSAGSAGYLKPQLLIEYILNRINGNIGAADIVYTRTDLLMKAEGSFKPLLNVDVNVDVY